MRSGFVAAFMGIGGIFVCFAVVVFVIEIFARQGNVGHQLATMSALGVLTLVAGLVLFALGYFLNRVGRTTRDDSLSAGR
ncbi:MAG: hypothetical protein QOK07_1394 [Gemmatimonadaceae bacterium]|jgi:uncharacterized membrane protein YcjF (UPF0283 family)|nr:hypothetical protein [Gemmatimonadaceae bacterium]